MYGMIFDGMHTMKFGISNNQTRSASMLEKVNEIIESSQSYKIVEINNIQNKTVIEYFDINEEK